MDREAFNMKCYVHPDVEAIGTCTSCGKAICSTCSMEVGGKLVCKPCAEKIAAQCVTAQAASKKEPALALLLSLVGGLVSGLLIGLGQLYNGQVKKGIILCAVNIVLAFTVLFIYICAGIVTIPLLGIGFICCIPVLFIPLGLWFWAMYDAYVTADKINKGEPVKDWLD
jgi:TM2 domain-containing membrane protein YozV